MNKKATEVPDMLMIFIFLAYMVMIGLGLIVGVSLFFGEEYDFRQADADVLSYRITNCIKEKEIDWNLPNEQLSSEIFKKCRIQKEIIETTDYVLHIDADGIPKYYFGDEIGCRLAEKNEEYPRCNIQKFTKEFNKALLNFEVISGSNQKIKRELTG